MSSQNEKDEKKFLKENEASIVMGVKNIQAMASGRRSCNQIDISDSFPVVPALTIRSRHFLTEILRRLRDKPFLCESCGKPFQYQSEMTQDRSCFCVRVIGYRQCGYKPNLKNLNLEI